MKTIKLLTMLMLFAHLTIGQTKFYDAEGKKKPVIGEETLLTFTEGTPIPTNTTGAAEGFLATGIVAEVLPSLIDLGFKISSNLIEGRVKKFTNEFSTRNTYIGNIDTVPAFEVKREVMLKEGNKKEDALLMRFVPVMVDTGWLAYRMDSLICTLSGAKVKKKYPYNDYVVELKVRYYDGKKEQEKTMSPITVSLVKIGGEMQGESGKYLSDPIAVGANFRLLGVEAKIVETNVSKVRAEKIKALAENYGDDVKDQVKTIVNYYIDKNDNNNK